MSWQLGVLPLKTSLGREGEGASLQGLQQPQLSPQPCSHTHRGTWQARLGPRAREMLQEAAEWAAEWATAQQETSSQAGGVIAA